MAIRPATKAIQPMLMTPREERLWHRTDHPGGGPRHGLRLGALGADLSRDMIELARRLAESEGVGNAVFEQADAQVHPFSRASFDVAISRTGAMFFGQPAATSANIASALRPGGRLVLLVWQGPGPNEWVRELEAALAGGRELPGVPIGAPGPFGLAGPGRLRALLAGAGFIGTAVEGVEAPMWFGADAEDAHHFVLGLMGWMLDGLDAPARATAEESLRALLADHEGADGVTFRSGTWLLRATRA